MAQPMYQQIAEDLRAQIDSGAIARGSQLPTELELREKYKASRNTIRDAIQWLIRMKLVETRQGQGTFVTRKIDPFVTVLSTDPQAADGSVDPEAAAYLSEVSDSHRVATRSTPKVGVETPSAEVSKRLRLAAGEQVISRHQERFIDGIPWSLQTSFFPMKFVTTSHATRLIMAEDIEDGAVRYLEQAIGLKQVGYRDWITARHPVDHEQQFFGLTHDATVFVIYRTGFDHESYPMRVTVTIFPADRNQFIVNAGELPDPQYDQAES